MQPATDDLAAFISGFVAAEGSFVVSAQSSRFKFAVGLGASDSATCELMRSFFCAGRLYRSERRAPNYDDEVAFAVQALPDLIAVIVPFMDEHLPPSYKREQYLRWREQLIDYWDHRARRTQRCSEHGCELPSRARGLCRGHYYRAFGA